MRIKDLGSRPAPASLRELISHVMRGRGPATVVNRREMPYWQERNWTRKGNVYTGNYQTPYSAFQGWIEEDQSGHINFFLYQPTPQIQRHSHWACFQRRNEGWYLVHMGRAAKDVSSGIMTIERLITEAYEK